MAAAPQTKKKKRTFWQRYRIAIVAGSLVFIGLFVAVINFALHSKPSTHKPQNLVTIQLPKPPPPPTPPPTPPPPTPPPKPEEKMVEQEPVKEEPKPVEKPPEAPALGSAIKGDGNDGFGLSGSGDGRIGGLGGNGNGNRSKWGWYAGQVQQSVVAALKAHKLTRSASLSLTVRVWADSTGRIVKASLAGSSGTAATDAAIKNEILTGLQLAQAPPEGMPMPIVMRISARRPN